MFDFSNPATKGSFMGALRGKLSSDVGRASITGAVQREDDASTVRVGAGVADAMADEVQILIRTHGPPVATLLKDQLTIFDGGCARSGPPEATFECYMAIYARHTAAKSRPALLRESQVLAGDLAGEATAAPVDGAQAVLVVSNSANLAFGSITTTNLTPGDAISTTWLVFNRPENCAGGRGTCTTADLDVPSAEPHVLDARGGIVQDDGSLRASAGPLSSAVTVREGTGEIAIDTAELILVLRSHGQALLDQPLELEEQLTANDGARDVNTCADVQFARYLPVE